MSLISFRHTIVGLVDRSVRASFQSADELSPLITLTHWGRMTHICVSTLTIIGWDNGLSPDRRQAIIWTNAAILLIGPLGTNLSEILIEIVTFSFKTMRLKVSSVKRRPFCLGLHALTTHPRKRMPCWPLTLTPHHYHIKPFTTALLSG